MRRATSRAGFAAPVALAAMGRHAEALADRGAGLFLRNLLWLSGEAEPAHAESDRTGTDNDDFHAFGAQRCDLGADGGDATGIELADVVGEHAGAEFDDDALRCVTA